MIVLQRRRMRQLERLQGSLTVGDRVRTIGGIYGTILDVRDDRFVLDTGHGARLEVARRAVAERIGEDE
ncbi:MAG TPA: preprotein translocase subunit YajC [Actinobacteria bacterium]|nr:preprotein translocase subunit YajC [Actinomycetota bacterium]